jgi:hypothetical protein
MTINFKGQPLKEAKKYMSTYKKSPSDKGKDDLIKQLQEDNRELSLSNAYLQDNWRSLGQTVRTNCEELTKLKEVLARLVYTTTNLRSAYQTVVDFQQRNNLETIDPNVPLSSLQPLHQLTFQSLMDVNSLFTQMTSTVRHWGTYVATSSLEDTIPPVDFSEEKYVRDSVVYKQINEIIEGNAERNREALLRSQQQPQQSYRGSGIAPLGGYVATSELNTIWPTSPGQRWVTSNSLGNAVSRSDNDEPVYTYNNQGRVTQVDVPTQSFGIGNGGRLTPESLNRLAAHYNMQRSSSEES